MLVNCLNKLNLQYVCH